MTPVWKERDREGAKHAKPAQRAIPFCFPFAKSSRIRAFAASSLRDAGRLTGVHGRTVAKVPRSDGFPYWHELVLVALLIGLMVYAGITEPVFVRPQTQIALSSDLWERAILALPMTLIIITAGIDLSVGSAMALCAIVMGALFQAGAPMSIAIAAALLSGIVGGLLNGVFISFVGVHPLLVTLATYSAFRGFAEGISHGQAYKGFPSWFANISGTVGGVPIAGIIFVLGAIVTAIVLRRTPLGRSIYAMGFNETACRFSGIPTRRIKLLLYALAGLSAGVASVIYTARVSTAGADQGTNYELDVITAVVLGGTSIFGGRGRVLGTVLGLLLIHETREFVSWHWQNEVLISLVIGLLLIGSVLLNTLLTPRTRE
jgi:rhamnose transport system permease protein